MNAGDAVRILSQVPPNTEIGITSGNWSPLQIANHDGDFPTLMSHTVFSTNNYGIIVFCIEEGFQDPPLDEQPRRKRRSATPTE